jgi:hypothetical protein
VFVNFVDHGGGGIVAMPNGPYLHAADLVGALKTMHSKKMYDQKARACSSLFARVCTRAARLASTGCNL